MPPETTYVPSLDAQAPLVSLAGLVKWLRITPGYAAKLRNSGVFPPYRDSDGNLREDRFDLFDCVGRYLSHLRTQLKQKPTSELRQANLARAQAQTETF